MTRAPPPEPTLLVVDDEESVATTLAAVLAADGYRVETARSVDEALARIAETAFTAAVLDLNLDTGDGLTVLARLKESSPETVAVALTGYASLGSALGAIRAGVDGYLVKPCDIEELKATLVRGRTRAEQAAERTVRLERHQRLVADASRLLAEARLDQAAVLEALARAVAASLADTCTIHLVESGGTELRPAAVHDPDPERAALRRTLLAEHPLRVGEGVAGGVVASGEPVVVAGDRAAFEAGLKQEYRPHADRLFFQSVAVVPLRGQHGVVGALAAERLGGGRAFSRADVDLLQEIGDRAALAIENARLYREARQAIAARDEFLSIAAHELRTPVTSLRGNAQLLARAKARGRLDETRLDRFVSTIVESTTRLATLIDDLLDVSRIQSGRLALRRREIDLCALIGAIVETHSETSPTPHQIEAALPATCQLAADPDRLAQVIENLLGNAVKYSPEGGLIRIELEPGAEEVHLRVVDQGIGLPPGSGDEIFEPFGRAANAIERALPGMGLGLYICRSIVERHGGRLWAESPGEDRGTTLHMTLPTAGEAAGAETD